MNNTDKMQKIISLAKRRGFVFPGSEIYGGLANTYDFGPLGAEMLRNIVNDWWKTFVLSRSDIYGMDSAVLMSPKVWEASGHTQRFNDVMIDCKKCKFRTRADHLIEDATSEHVEGRSVEEQAQIIKERGIKCPKCGAVDWTAPRLFNNLFETKIGIVEDSKSLAYLRGEIAQGMFVNFKNVTDSMRPRLPFGIAQAGKAFRNEITLGNFFYRTLEFTLAEFEYFLNPLTDSWERVFNYWQQEMEAWALSLGFSKENISWRTHTDEERSHYSTKTIDMEYNYPFGVKELWGLAYRTDFDLRNHMEKSGQDLRYVDPETQEKVTPHVVEPTFGITRTLLALLCEAYTEDEDGRVVLKLSSKVAPYKAAIFPLVANKPELLDKAKEVYAQLKKSIHVAFDARGNIGKRYLSQDEIGTPYCITVDYQTLEDNAVTVRDRDTKEQKRVLISELEAAIKI